MIITIASVLPFELKHFYLFHVVLHIDVKMKTNKEECPLVMGTSKDSSPLLLGENAALKGWQGSQMGTTMR